MLARVLPFREPGALRRRQAAELATTAFVAAVVGLGLAKLGNPDDQVKAALAMVGVVVIVAGALHPVYGLALVLLLAPLRMKLTVGGVQTGTTEIMVVGLAIALAARVTLSAVPGWIRAGGLMLIIGSALSIAVAEDPGYAAWGCLRWTFLMVLLFVACTVFRGRGAQASKGVVDVLAVSGAIAAAAALGQKIGIAPIVGPAYFPDQPDSFFDYYTNYAGFAGIVAIVLIGELLQSTDERRTGRATLIAGALLLDLLGLVVCGSRGGVVSVGAGVFVLVILALPRASIALRLLAVLAVIGAAGFITAPPESRTALVERFQAKPGSQHEDKQRFALQSAGRQAALHHPLGLGYGNFQYYMRRNVRSRFINSQTFFHSHQTPTQMAIDSGWLGFAGWIVLLFGGGVLAVRAVARRAASGRALGFVAALFGFLAQSLFDYLFFELAIGVVFIALIFGAVCELDRRWRSDPAPVPSR